ncbi:ABC transporter permease [[Clostridium] dakarense]|uniref:ABC transporter permease n=1 Tax=Faecalimicrobium dakarense TaxID=1301100 RepID=UPI0004AEBB5F|nr:ABC transporter permease [[Clostridium] dakarense]
MLGWELKKIIKNKTSIIALILMGLLFIQIGFFKPMLETENEYFDESKNEYIIDKRPEDVIAQEKLDNKVNEIKSIANKNTHGLKNEKQISKMSKEKLDKDSGEKYKDVRFYQVFENRATFPLATLLIVAIIVTLSSNLYTDERLSNVDSIILSSKNKYKALNSKLLISLIIPIVVYAIYIIAVFITTYTQYGVPINGSLQAYRISSIASLVREMSITQYIASEIGVISLVLIVISIFSALFSFITKNSIQSISCSILFIAMGKILVFLEFLPYELMMIIHQCSFIDILSKNSFISTAYMGEIKLFSMNFDLVMTCLSILVLIIVSGVLLNVYVFKKVLNR